MKTILQILARAGGWHHGLYLKIGEPALSSAHHRSHAGTRPVQVRSLSVMHYREENSGLLRTPEMRFELSKPFWLRLNLVPFSYRNDRLGIEQISRTVDGDHYLFLPELYDRHRHFAKLWDKRLRIHGYLGAFDRQQSRH